MLSLYGESLNLSLWENWQSSSIKSGGLKVNSAQYKFLQPPFEGLGRIKHNKQKPPSKGPEQKQIAPAWLQLYQRSAGSHQKGFVNCYLLSRIPNKLTLYSVCLPLTSCCIHRASLSNIPGYWWPSCKQGSVSLTSLTTGVVTKPLRCICC